MFYDERIVKESGKIYRKAILFTWILALGIILLKLPVFIYTLAVHGIWFKECSFWVEGMIFIISFVLFLIGECFHKGSDEREILEKSSFYYKFGKLIIAAALLGQALDMLWLVLGYGRRMTLDNLSVFIFMAGFIYFYFKKNSIYVNYDALDLDRKDFYIKILIRTFLIAGVIILTYLVPFITAICIGKFRNYERTLFILFGISIVVEPLLYFVLSAIERLDYQDEAEGVKASVVPMGIAMILTRVAVMAVEVFYYCNLSINGLSDLEYLSNNIYWMRAIPGAFSSMLIYAALAYMYEHSKKEKMRAMLYVCFIVEICFTVLSLVEVNLYNSVGMYLATFQGVTSFGKFSSVISVILRILNFMFIMFVIAFMIFMMVEKYSKVLIVGIILIVLCIVLEILFIYGNSSDMYVSNIISFFISPVYVFFIFMAMLKKRKSERQIQNEN